MKDSKRQPVTVDEAVQYLRKHASVLMELPAGEQFIGARDSVLCSALHQIADALSALADATRERR